MRIVAESEILRNFDGIKVVRARELERNGAVREAILNESGWLFGRVRGDSSLTYYPVVRVRDSANGLSIRCQCTCEDHQNCRHALALMLHSVHRGALKVAPETEYEALPPTSPEVERWLDQVREAAAPKNRFPTEIVQRLIYVLSIQSRTDGTPVLHVKVASSKMQKDGQLAKVQPYRTTSVYTGDFARYIRASDISILKALDQGFPRETGPFAHYRLESFLAEPLLQRLLATGRTYLECFLDRPLSAGPQMDAVLEWRQSDSGVQSLNIVGFHGKILPTLPAYYLDPETGSCGRIASELDAELLSVLLSSPIIPPEFSGRAIEVLRVAPHLAPNDLPQLLTNPSVRRVRPTPRLRIVLSPARLKAFGMSREGNLKLPTGSLEFLYERTIVPEGSGAVRVSEGGQPIVYIRDASAEASALQDLVELGWDRLSGMNDWKVADSIQGYLALAPLQSHPTQEDLNQLVWRFYFEQAERLREKGWEIEFDVDGSLLDRELVEANLKGSVSQNSAGDYLIKILLASREEEFDFRPALDRFRAWPSEGTSDTFYYQLPNGKMVALPSRQIESVGSGLAELLGSNDRLPREFKVQRPKAMELLELGNLVSEWSLPEKLAELKIRLQKNSGPSPLVTPKSFVGVLRKYQEEGVQWLAFLADFELGGILADDMGLGKTVQTLVHILQEKELGRLDRPALIVCPTSTIPNWIAEVERFAPSLRVLRLQGIGRRSRFGEIENSDIVLTTYSLLPKDADELLKRDYHVVFLDEAQLIKNAGTAAAKAAFGIRAHHRIALSGTPIENNVQELWSLFRFALPGLLGSFVEFRRTFQQDEAPTMAHANLARTIRPFILRRTKEQVAPELPPKTIVVERVEMNADQRELYDSYLARRSGEIHDLIQSKGLEKSRMQVLEVLLRLRQICCEPRLLGTEEVASVSSAKLERLMELLRELHASSRKVLVFSQFTSMLDLIEPELVEAAIPFVRLSGDTQDRSKPVEEFQKGETTVFLISLKAGGVGINLTAADTVIHYDPWWNPAVENQATDRAHRIGQSKPVFVYKLVASGSVEEKILELQRRKADLAEKVLSASTNVQLPLTLDDINWMFSPELNTGDTATAMNSK